MMRRGSTQRVARWCVGNQQERGALPRMAQGGEGAA